ncbi:MAG: dihydrodipicolinate synthase family protein [Chloroflexota bacterium]
MLGIFPILVTPFEDDDRVDADSLRNLVDFNIGAGVHGLGIALGTEILKLTEAERSRVISVVVEQARGRVPVVVNTGAQANLTAVLYSRQAEDLGAAAVMCLPPSPVSATEARSYFKAVSDAIHIPVFIQDTLTTPVPAGLIRQIAEESERVRYAQGREPAPTNAGPGRRRGERRTGQHLRRRRGNLPAGGAAAAWDWHDALAEPAARLRRDLERVAGGRRTPGHRDP